jgi:hypothetical protein
MEENERKPPLGLPEGSVRSIIALSLSAVYAGLCVYAVVGERAAFEVVLSSVSALTGVVITWYFKTRESKSQ